MPETRVHIGRSGRSVIGTLQTHFENGALTSVGLVERYLERIARYDKIGASINAILELNPDVLKAAAALDAERRGGTVRSVLHGIPLLIKDNISTKDRLSTSLASHLMLGLNSGRDASIVARLRQAGVVILGKANMDEFACSHGVASGRGGQVRNPYCLSRSASGSSSGSAAAVAAGFCPAALGTDTHGSIRFPASDCSLVAMRPTVGLLSRRGVFPARATIDTAGPMTVTVTDAAILLRHMTKHPIHAARLDALFSAKDRVTGRVGRRSLDGTRVAVLTKGLLGVHAGVDQVIGDALATLAAAGARLIEIDPIPLAPYGGSDPEQREMIRRFDQAAIADYFAHLPSHLPERSLECFVASSLLRTVPSSLHGYWTAGNGWELLAGWAGPRGERPSVPNGQWPVARRRFFEQQRRLIREALARCEADTLVFPTKSVPARSILHVDAERGSSYRQELLSSYSGLPEVTVPAGYTDDSLPVGLSFLGATPFSEWRLLRLASAFERARPPGRAPRLTDRRSGEVPVLPDVPPNDRFDTRRRLEGRAGCVRGNNLFARVEPHEPRHGTRRFIDRTVWFVWRAEQAGRARFWLQDLPASRQLISVYTGNTLPELREIVCCNYHGVVESRSATFAACAHTDYQIVVGADEQIIGSGDFILRWESEGL